MANHSEEIQHWQKLLKQHRQNAQKLREQLATFGKGEERLDKLNQLDAEEDAIREAKAALRSLEELPDQLPGDPEEVESFPERFTEEFPHPIAVACHRFNRATGDVERFRRLDDLLQHTVKYLAAIALAQYRSDSPQEDRLCDWLAALSRPNLEAWIRMLGEIYDHYEQEQTLPRVASELVGAYRPTVSDDSPMARAHRQAVEALEGKKAARRMDDTTPRAFLERWVTYRHRWEAADPDASECQKLSWVLQPALRQFLERFTLVAEYPLRYVERADRTGEGWFYTMLSFRGHTEWPTPLTDPFHDADQGETPNYKPRRLYLCASDGQPLLNLHPILISHFYHLYFLEYNEENRDICYRPCHQGEMYYPPSYVNSYILTCFGPPAEEGKEVNIVAQLDQASDELEKDEQAERWVKMPLPILFAHISDEGRQALEIALGEALRIGRFWLGVEFLLMGLSKQDGRPFSGLLHELRVSRGDFRGALRGMVGVVKDDWRRANVAELGADAFEKLQPADPATLAADFAADEERPPVITPRMMQVLRDAAELAGEGQIGHSHLLLAALRHPQCLAVNLLLGQAIRAGWDPREVPAWVAQQASLQPPDLGQEAGPLPKGPPVRPARPDSTQPPPLKVRGVLAKYGRDLTDLAGRGDLRPAVGESAHKAMVQMGLILQQTQANNPILLGDPGVGKTAIVEGFAYRLATDPEVIPQLAGKRIVDLPPTALLAGTKYRGDLEERLQQLVDEVRKAAGGTVVFIDEIHTILGGKAEGGLGAIADALKPALARGEFPCIGATTVGEYRRYIEADPALARRFAPVWLEEPTVEEAIEIVAIVAQKHLGPSHKVTYPQAVVEEAVHLSARYLHDERLPGKAVKLLDQAGPRVVMGGSLRGAEETDQDQPVGGEVTVEIVRKIVSERTGIPLTQLSKSDKERLLGLEAKLKERVKGQDQAVREVARVVKRARAGLADPRRPLGVFLFAGPTGVGKTELGLALAEALFDEEDAILRLDMSEYMEKHQVSRLIGSPPGYVGYEEEGQLTGRLRRRPYSVVLLDEIEKAHKDVQHLFLQLFDAGRLTDARGNLADGRNAIFIMTTNLGAKEALGLIKQREPYQEKLHAAIEDHFTPEFLNRIDRIVYFEPLTEKLLLEIFDKLFAPVAKRFQAQGILVEVTEPFKHKLCKRYADEKRGARPLERAIEDEIVAPLTDKLLDGEIGPGKKVVVGEGMEWEVSDTPLPSGFEEPVEGPSPPQLLDPKDPDARDELKAQNEVVFEREFEALEARLHERGIKVELDETAREFLCDPFWTETTLEQALVKLVEEPLMEQLEAGELKSGDRVRIEKYADHLEFKKVEGDEQ
jgi:ATP-dependent Clp protease ATP-binding subunit ClpC